MSSPIVPFRTQQAVTQLYQNAALALNNALNVLNPGDWEFKANAIGSVGAGLSQDMYILQKQIFPQTASGSNLDSFLACLNLPPRAGNLPALGQVVFSTLPSGVGTSVTIAQGQSFLNPLTSVTYTCTQTTVVTYTAYLTTPIPIVCSQVGSGFAVYAASPSASPPGTTLTVSSPIANVSNFTVTQMSDGTDSESDGEVANRILFAFQNPPGAGTISDYVRWGMATNGVTYVYNFITTIDNLNVVNVVLFGGTSNPDFWLANPGTLYSRNVSSLISAASTYINGVKPINNSVNVTSTETYQIPHTITVTVTLITGYSLTTNIPSVGLTVQELIQREVRRALISVPPGGILVDGQYVITMSFIAQVLDAGLSASAVQTGIYAAILVDRDVIYNGAYQAIPLPEVGGTIPIIDPATSLAQIIYDCPINYGNISVVLS